MFDRSEDVKSPEYLVVKEGQDSCTFIGREFLQEAAVSAGAVSEHGLDMGHDFFINKTPIRIRQWQFNIKLSELFNKLWLKPDKTN